MTESRLRFRGVAGVLLFFGALNLPPLAILFHSIAWDAWRDGFRPLAVMITVVALLTWAACGWGIKTSFRRLPAREDRAD